MKEVMAVIRPNKITPTKEALVAAGFPAFNAIKVVGRGKQAVDFQLCANLNEHPEDSSDVLSILARGPQLLAKRLISVVVPDDKVAKVLETLIAANQTGNPGDGKIFVMPVEEAVRVSNGIAGAIAVDEMTG
ncbi:MAG: P-II family nitrogen regulator [Hydrococcus sp. C42_A2020_068]|nr:nitrogen regulatory protein PII [Pleurocapsa sp. PCC 7327]MBF2020757.1 P-II family nitrogen regulator [Hydrococcus sp. C42_A2020_068]